VQAADSSSLIAFLAGAHGEDVGAIDQALASNALFLPPVVLTEVLSDPSSRHLMIADLSDCPILDILSGYWERAGAIRATLLSKKLKAKLPDALIAQSCIDHDVALITRDGDFRHFAKHCGLKLA
jgi:predicted nucleic acid-binding protein